MIEMSDKNSENQAIVCLIRCTSRTAKWLSAMRCYRNC